MPDGHIRAFQSDTPDLRGVSELNVHLLKAVSPTLTVNHVPKILIANERLQAVLHDALLR